MIFSIDIPQDTANDTDVCTCGHMRKDHCGCGCQCMYAPGEPDEYGCQTIECQTCIGFKKVVDSN